MRFPILIMTGLAIIMTKPGAPCAATTNMIANGSFEEGDMAPIGWLKANGGAWRAEGAKDGTHMASGSSRRESAVWTTEPLSVERGQSYRLSGWITPVSGAALLRVELFDAAGGVVGKADSAPVEAKGGAGWRYAACEIDAPAGAATARASLVVRGEAMLDAVVLVPLIDNILYNPTFDGDNRGRIGFWDPDPLIERPGTRGGAHHADLAAGRDGKSALVVEADTGWYAVRNIANTIPMGMTVYRLSGWTRTLAEGGTSSGAGEPGIGIQWLTFNGEILRVDLATPRETVDGWTRVEMVSPAPENAEIVTVSIVVDHGRAAFDDFDLRPVAVAANVRPAARVHVNQVGYERTLPKSAVVATNFIPGDGRGTLEIVGANGRSAKRIAIAPSGRIHDGKPDDWGSYFWRADFSDFRTPGTYRARVRIGDVTAESPQFQIGDDIVFGGTANLGVDFFYVQRCGFAVPGWHAACHLDDANLPDGTHIDATGGWHSAGDYNKIMYDHGDGGCAYAIATAWEVDSAFLSRADRDGDGLPDALDEAKWGADFMTKMQVPATGGFYKDVRQGTGRGWMKWTAPEEHTDNIVGTPDDPVIDPGEGGSGLVIGAWLRLARIFDERGIRTDYRERAVRFWNHATKNGTVNVGAYQILSALDLFDATGEAAYLDAVRRAIEANLASQTADGRHKGAFGEYGEYVAGAMATFALRHPSDPLVPRIKAALPTWVAFAASTADNPFGFAKQSVGEKDYFFEPTSALGHNWEIFARGWAALLIGRLTGDERALRFGVDQIDWVLGKNPYGLCQLEGAGTNNPPRYHHRYDMIPGHERGAVPGAVPNGFVRTPRALDAPGFDMSGSRKEKLRVSYRTSEPWLVHNLWHLLAVSELKRTADAIREPSGAR